MSDREYVVTFDPGTGKPTIRLARLLPDGTAITIPAIHAPHFQQGNEFHVYAPSALRAEQIARAMKGNK